MYCIAGSDFNSALLPATFPAGDSSTSVTVTVFLDNMLEGNETFSLDLRVSVPRVLRSRSRGNATGIIIDSTSKFICIKLMHTDLPYSEKV